MDYRAPVPDAPLLVVSTQVVALDRATGRQLWRYDLDAVGRRFAIDQNRIFVFESEGRLHCIDVATGRALGVVVTELRSANNMLVDGDRIYLSDDNFVVAVDMNGRILWREKVPNNTSHSLCGLGVPGGNVVQPDFSRAG